MNKWTRKLGALTISSLGLAITAFPNSGYTELKVVPYGYTKLDVQYNSKMTGAFPSPSLTSFPYNNNLPNQHSELVIDARRARIGIRATEEWKQIKFLGVIEGDFYTFLGDATATNSRVFRFRYGYAKAELPSGFYFLGGQFRTLFQNLYIAIPDIIDDNGPVGGTDVREPIFQIGYVKQTCDMGLFKIEQSFEKHALNNLGVINADILDQSNSNTNQGAWQKLPLFVTKFTWEAPKWFKTEIAGAITKSYVVLTKPLGQEVDTLVWGVETANQLKFGKFSVFGHGYYLNGLSRMVYPKLNDCVLVGTSLKPIHALGGFVGVRYEANPRLAFNLIGGWDQERSIPKSVQTGSATFRDRSIHANFMYTFWTRWKTAFEYQYVDLLAYNGQKGNTNIFHSALWFYF